MHPLAKLDHRYVWHPFTQMRDWLRREPIVIVEGKGAAAVLGAFRLTGGRWPARAKLVFHAYDGEHYLAEVWMPTSGTGSTISISKAEERLAEGGIEPETVAVLAPRP